MIFEKDNVLKEALEVIVSVRYDGEITNKDYLGYWSILNLNVLRTATASFRNGVNSFNDALREHANCKDLTSYHFRLMTTLLNTNSVITAADELFSVFAHNLREEISNDISFDLIGQQNQVVPLTGFEKVLLLMHMYQDTIDVAIASALPKPPKNRKHIT